MRARLTPAKGLAAPTGFVSLGELAGRIVRHLYTQACDGAASGGHAEQGPAGQSAQLYSGADGETPGLEGAGDGAGQLPFHVVRGEIGSLPSLDGFEPVLALRGLAGDAREVSTPAAVGAEPGVRPPSDVVRSGGRLGSMPREGGILDGLAGGVPVPGANDASIEGSVRQFASAAVNEPRPIPGEKASRIAPGEETGPAGNDRLGGVGGQNLPATGRDAAPAFRWAHRGGWVDGPEVGATPLRSVEDNLLSAPARNAAVMVQRAEGDAGKRFEGRTEARSKPVAMPAAPPSSPPAASAGTAAGMSVHGDTVSVAGLGTLRQDEGTEPRGGAPGLENGARAAAPSRAHPGIAFAPGFAVSQTAESFAERTHSGERTLVRELGEPGQAATTIAAGDSPADTAPARQAQVMQPDVQARQAERIVRQLAPALRILPDGVAELTLSPEELGRLRLSMVADGDRMIVQLAADRPETLDLLRRHVDQLGNALREAGFANVDYAFADQRRGGMAAGTTSTEGEVAAPAETGPVPARNARPGVEKRLDLRL